MSAIKYAITMAFAALLLLAGCGSTRCVRGARTFATGTFSS